MSAPDTTVTTTTTNSDKRTESPSSTAAPKLDDVGDPESTYHLKWIPWNVGKIPIVMQSINGPCPLIAIMNVLLLREKVQLPSMLEQITATQLLTYIGEAIMDSVPKSPAKERASTTTQAPDGAKSEPNVTQMPTSSPPVSASSAPTTTSTTTPTPATATTTTTTTTTTTSPTREELEDETALLNLEQNIHDAMEVLPKLKTGLDVNIRFTGITHFEYTPECIIFDLLRIPLYHGWLSDPELVELQNAIGSQSYNQLVDTIITNKNSKDPMLATKVLIAEEFLETTASQLTLHGLSELKARIKENEIGILFRNNHFLTLFKRDSKIYTLVTDHGYLTEDRVIWEILDNVEGAGSFFDANFQVAEQTNRQVCQLKEIDQIQQQLENDLLMALSLKEEFNNEGQPTD